MSDVATPAIEPTSSDLVNRELSWLSFNERVLQEAADPTVPLLERLFFCGVYASNLDEFFSVRVASLRSLLRLDKGDKGKLSFNPYRLLHDIHQTVQDLDATHSRTLSNILMTLRQSGIEFVDHKTVPASYDAFLRDHYQNEVRPHIEVTFLDTGEKPFLANGAVYLVTEVWPQNQEEIRSWAPSYGFVRVPSPPLARWVQLPAKGGEPMRVMLVDDVIRYNLDVLCGRRETGRAYAVMLTRDQDLYVNEVFDGGLPEVIRERLGSRATGAPSRFLYDMRSPYVMVHEMQHTLSLTDEDLVLGGRNHNLADLMSFPRFGRGDLSYPDWDPVEHPMMKDGRPMLEQIGERDHVVHTPYQSYDPVVRFIQEAAADPDVEEICFSVYRVASDSAFLNALIDATKAGKKVVVFMEIQARFDEESNLDWSDRLQEAGATVLFPTGELKVHAKIALVVRREDGGRRLYAFCGTGNFNEKTARIYADHGILTADERITSEVERVFIQLRGRGEASDCEHLLVAPHSLRKGFDALIESEIQAARRGDPSGMILKMNSLEDEKIIQRLYDASRAGVPIQIIVRGICRLIPGVPGMSESIEVRSIIDRYLEHARIYLFHAGGEEKMYIASADWMKRNLSRRVEVAVPVYDERIRSELRQLIDFQLADNVKARVIDAEGSNRYIRDAKEPVRSQEAFRGFVESL